MLHYIPRHNCEHLVSLMANLSNFSNSTYDMVFNTQVCLSNKKPNNLLSQLYLKKMVIVIAHDYKNTLT